MPQRQPAAAHPRGLDAPSEELLLQRDRLLEQILRDRSRRSSATLPALPSLAELQQALPPRTLYVAPTLVEDELHLLAMSRTGPARLFGGAGVGGRLLEDLAGLRNCLTNQLARYGRGLMPGEVERRELDGWLERLGQGILGETLEQALAGSATPMERLVWVPDTELHGLPLHALRRDGRYLIERLVISTTFSGSLLVHQERTRGQRRGRFGPALVVTAGADVLPQAGSEGEGVAATFLRSRCLRGGEATRAALRRELARARVVHFACHTHFDPEHPLAACVQLPSGELLHTPEWLHEPVAGLPLVTLSACRSAEVAPLLGREVFGLVTGLLGGGVRAVVAGLWPVADRETVPLMWRFYRHRMADDLPTALARAQRETLVALDSSPLFWAPFALFGDSAALPAVRCWLSWWARWRQRRHTRRFPTGERGV